MRKYNLFCMAFIILLLLCSCEKGDNMKFTASDSQTNITSLITTIYSDEQLDKINTNNNDINQLNADYPIQCLREIDSHYEVVYRGNQKILIVIFDHSGNKILSKVYNISVLSSTFDVLSVGHSICEVQKIDPKGDYTFLYTGRNDVPFISYHYTSDGYIIQIKYNDKNEIINIDKDFI